MRTIVFTKFGLHETREFLQQAQCSVLPQSVTGGGRELEISGYGCSGICCYCWHRKVNSLVTPNTIQPSVGTTVYNGSFFTSVFAASVFAASILLVVPHS